MCGLVGMFSMNVTAAEQKAFNELLYMDTLRGWDGTGMCAVQTKKDKVAMYKRAIPGPDFINTRVFERITRDMLAEQGILMGHNRWATKGGVSDNTSHPFEHDDVILMHNGTLSNHKQLGGGNQFEVDSEAICWAISQADDCKDVITNLQGAFALTWYDGQDKTINFSRNDERPLWMAEIQNVNGKTKGIIWASEPWMLERCHGYIVGLTLTKPYQLKEGIILSYDTEDDFACVRSEEVVLWKPKKWQGGTGGTAKKTTPLRKHTRMENLRLEQGRVGRVY